jgi:threonine/homoserine/homoserine lactone efflux protein
MTPEQALAFFLFALVAAVTPGPSNIMLTAVGANVGVVRGLPSLFGVTGGMGFMMFVVAFGLGSLVLETPLIMQAIKWCGVGFLLWLSWKIATAGRGEAASEREPVGFLAAAAFQWVNPKSWLVSTAAAGTYLHAEAGSALVQSMAFAILFVLAAAPSCLLWLAFGATMQRWLHGPRALKLFNIAMAALLAGSVALILW